MNKCIAINLIKNAKYRATHTNFDKTKTVTIRVGKITVAVINETITCDGKVWFVHLKAAKARIVDNLQQAYAMAMDDFIVALKYENLRFRITNVVKEAVAGVQMRPKYTLVDCAGHSYIYRLGLGCYSVKPVTLSVWEVRYDTDVLERINKAINRYENA